MSFRLALLVRRSSSSLSEVWSAVEVARNRLGLPSCPFVDRPFSLYPELCISPWVSVSFRRDPFWPSPDRRLSSCPFVDKRRVIAAGGRCWFPEGVLSVVIGACPWRQALGESWRDDLASQRSSYPFVDKCPSEVPSPHARESFGGVQSPAEKRGPAPPAGAS